MKSVAITLCLLGGAGLGHSQEAASAAVPNAATFAPIFTISWNLTPNVVHYDAKLKDGKFDPKEPISVYWVMNTKGGRRESLTLIERLKAYGFTARPGGEPDSYDVVIVSVKKKTMHVARKGDSFEVTLSIGECRTARLERAQVQAHKWHFLNVADYVELTGTDLVTGAECRERVNAE